ncbi:hypothetical protein BGZ60DRAFT_415174 [Tricladium varicosporioides]|nr:hypothetical protein BGZ60DRAFT_415174 [Hymenoscyphus varicosporioides]
MHQALLIPEIVATILQNEGCSLEFLHTCLFVNKLFSIEATRILWIGCGVSYTSEFGYIHPHIKHLAHLVLLDAQRAQFYANFIHTLMIAQEFENDRPIDEARWHKQLTSLQFPHLEEVSIDEYDEFSINEDEEPTLRNTEDMVIHYLQPKVKDFRLGRGSGISDTFMNTLSRSCPELTSLSLQKVDKCSVSKDGLVRFLTNANSLEVLDIGSSFNGSWSSTAFDIMARNTNLELLKIPHIQDEWVLSLPSPNYDLPAFRKLEFLETGISDQGLDSLARYIPHSKLETLSICLQSLPPSHHILASASAFTRLTKLVVYFGPESSLNGPDLLGLAQKCPGLTELSIGGSEDGGTRPSAVGITDSLIGEVAQHLPKIQSLKLLLSRPDILTWHAVLSIARYCTDLEDLELSCNFKWKDAVNSTQENAFPKLRWLKFALAEDDQNEEFAPGNEEAIKAIATRFAKVAPKLSSITIISGNEVDESLGRAIHDICMWR